MPVTVRFDPTANSKQAQVIPDATPQGDGVMSKEQAAQLAALVNATDDDSTLTNVQQQGTLQIGGLLLPTDGPDQNTILAYKPGETVATKWLEWIADFPNPFGTARNQEHGEGWNRGPNGRIDLTRGSLALVMEAFFRPSALIKNLELYFESQDEAGNSYRPFEIEQNQVAGSLPLVALRAGILNFQTPAGVDMWKWNLPGGGFVQIDSPITPIFVTSPLIAVIRQQSNLGNYSVDLLALNGADEVQLGNDSVDTRVGRGLKVGTVPANADAFIELDPGENVAVAPANTARERYNNTTKNLEQSIDGGPWSSNTRNANVSGTFPGDTLDHVLYSLTPGPNAFGEVFGVVTIFADDLSGSQQYTISAAFSSDGAGNVTAPGGEQTFGGLHSTGPGSTLKGVGTALVLVGNHNKNCKYAAHFTTIVTSPTL